jgi:hypothetical protein
MATTTNFGFETPDDTDLVKDGALAIRTALDDVDGRFGNVATYPNQIVNVVSGVSRPVPFATNQGSVNITFAGAGSQTVSVTFAASRFTQAPLIQVTPNTANANVTAAAGSQTTSGFTVYAYSPSGATRSFHWSAVQMTSAAAAG